MRFAKQLLFVLPGVFLFIVVAGCTPLVPASNGTVTPIILVTDTSSPSANRTGTPVVRATPRLSSTFTATQTRTNTPTLLLPTSTLTIPATLERDQAFNEIRKLLENPLQCPSPCFWGIIPNMTTLGEANNFFVRLRAPLQYVQADEAYYASPQLKDLSMGVQLEIQGDLVNRIHGRIGFENYQGQEYVLLRSAYAPDRLLRLYGKPSQVEISISYPTEPGFPPEIAWYSIILRFDQYPFVVDYYSSEVKDGKYISVCPLTDRFTVIDAFYGYPPKTYRSKGLFGTPLEKVTSLDVIQFYDLMTQEEGPACFEINTEAYKNP